METGSVIEKIRKLLALATSDNPHEAALAASRAEALLEKHNLDLAIVEAAGEAPKTTVDVETIILGHGGSVRWQGLIADGIAQTAYCRCYYAGGIRRGRLAIVGTEANRAAVIELHTWLCQQVIRLTRREFGAVAPRGRIREADAFMLGAACTIRSRLVADHQARTEAAEESRALVVQHQARNTEFMEGHGIKLRKTSSKRTRYRTDRWNAYQNGLAAGRGVSLRPQRTVTGNRGLLR